MGGVYRTKKVEITWQNRRKNPCKSQGRRTKVGGPMTPAARARWARAKRKPGRPRCGKGAKVISVSVERALLSRSDALAKDMGLTRAGLIERGLQAVLATEGKR